jgi:uncharacterized protein (DUF1800 family)
MRGLCAAKLRTPHEFMSAALRAIDRVPDDVGPIVGPLAAMGMPLWQPPEPNGWPGTVAAWASPEGLKSRLEVSAAISARVKNLINPTELLDQIAGDAASADCVAWSLSRRIVSRTISPVAQRDLSR